MMSALANDNWGTDWTWKYLQIFVCSISEAYSLIFPVYLLLCSIYVFKALLPLELSWFWEFFFLLQISLNIQFSNLLEKDKFK